MQVTLINYTPNPELLCAAAARLCYRDISAAEILKNISNEEINKLLDIIISSGHHSVIEHITFTFAIDEVSRILTHQLVRHRVGIAFSQQSQRYTSINNAGYIIPPTIKELPELRKEYETLMNSCIDFYHLLQEKEISNEDARFTLPQAIKTRLVMTVNFRQLLHMYSIDACLRSQWEIRKLLVRIKNEIRKISPRLAGELKIKCFASGYCDEKMMCNELKGKMPRKEDMLNSETRYNKSFYSKLAKEIGEEPTDESAKHT